MQTNKSTGKGLPKYRSENIIFCFNWTINPLLFSHNIKRRNPWCHNQPLHPEHSSPLRWSTSVCKCVGRCKCLCTRVCVFVWHGWSEECSDSRLAEPSQWTSSFTLQGNSSLIQRERTREEETPGLNVCKKLTSSWNNCTYCVKKCNFSKKKKSLWAYVFL